MNTGVVAISFSGDLPDLEIKPTSPALAGGFLTTSATREVETNQSLSLDQWTGDAEMERKRLHEGQEAGQTMSCVSLSGNSKALPDLVCGGPLSESLMHGCSELMSMDTM